MNSEPLQGMDVKLANPRGLASLKIGRAHV